MTRPSCPAPSREVILLPNRNGVVTVHVKIDVLYPPGIPTIQLQDLSERKNITETAKLVEHKSYHLLCKADANPPPSEYIWVGPQITDLTYNATIDLPDVKRTQNGIYSCHARNMMHPTYGENRTKEMASTVNVEILFKPSLAAINTQNIAEGSTFNITCDAISANPSDINFTWTRNSADLNRISKELVLQNVSRHDAMNYTCTVKNCMKPTVGEDEEEYASETFYLNVWYRASVKRFVVNGHEHDVHIVTNESSMITFACEIDSNPNSTVKIITPNGTEIISAGTNVFEYDYLLSSCVDNGTYTCSGSNTYNYGQPGLAELSVFVNSVAYPEPKFTWEKLANSSWHKILNDNIFSISSFGLQSNLTVNNFTTSTANSFRLTVYNGVGRLTQNYTLKPFDISREDATKPESKVGLVVGSISGGVAFVTLGAVITILVYKKRYQKRSDSSNGKRSFDDGCEMNSLPGRNDPIKHEPVYEGLKPVNERGYVEMKEQTYDILKQKQDSSETKDPIYTNLKL